MFRRSRFSFRPNVGTAGRAATPQEAPSGNQEVSETAKDVGESSAATAVTENKSDVTPSVKPTAPGDGNDQNGEGTSSSAAVQRRKRFAVKPKVAPGRPSTLARTPKSPVKAVSETSIEVSGSDLDKPTTASQNVTTAAPKGLQSPRRRMPSEESKQPKVQIKPTVIPSDSSGPSAEDLLEAAHQSAEGSKELESSQVKESPPRLADKVPPSLPDKEAIEISEKAKTLVSSKSGRSVSPAAFSLSRLLNDPSDLQRLAKARKLRELLRQEMHKEKKIKKAKSRAKEFTLDPSKMTMRDLIRYLPLSNPMTSSLEDPTPENETVVPPSPGREESPERAQEPDVVPKIASPREEEEEEEEVAAAAEEEQEEALMVPQVKVAEDGSLIIDEESLTVEVQRAKGPNPAQDRDPIFERGSTTTYSSFRKGTYSKPWSSEETDMFFLAISMVGTDFSMICQLFPHRARSEIKNKFKKEERENAWRIDKAFRERRKLDIEYFSKLLEKILEVQKNRKKLKSLSDKNSPKKHKRKSKGKKSATKLSDVEEEDEEADDEIPDLEEGEKENEDLCNEGGSPASKPKKKRKRKNRQDASNEEPDDKKNKTGEKSSEQDDACIPEDAEAALPEDRANSDLSEKAENVNAAKDTAIKPAKLSRGRAPKPLLPLGRKWGKKPSTPSTKAQDAVPDKGDGSVSDGASKEQGNEDESPQRQAATKSNDDISSEEEDAAVQPPRPTRYGRMPKPTKPLNYPAKDDAHSTASETTPASPAGPADSASKSKPKCTAKRKRSSKPQTVQESKKPKLVTLRASQTEYSDEENEKQWEDVEVEVEQHPACSSSKDSTAPAFVPASLRSPHPVISEVEETMEELDILANMPDVLGISQDALCPDVSCELAQNESGTAESCEHQLDLLVDVIDFLSSEHTEVSEDESYNEAAQTLLAIGNLAPVSQSAENLTAIQDHTTGTTSANVDETSQHLEEENKPKADAHEENSAASLKSATSSEEVTDTTETVATVELQNSTTDGMSFTDTSDQGSSSDMNPTPQMQSSPERSQKNSSQARKGRLSKVKPKPNLGQTSKTAQSKPQSENSKGRIAEEMHTATPSLSQVTETLSAAEETTNVADCCPKLATDENSSIQVKHTEQPSCIQNKSVGQIKASAATSDQNTSDNQSHCFSDTTLELETATRDSTTEPTGEASVSRDEPVSRCGSLVTSDTAVTELEGTNVDSALVRQSGDQLSPCVTAVEDLPVSQKEESEDTATRWKSRFQRVKPKPNLAQASRTKDISNKKSKPTPNLKFQDKTIVDVRAEPTCTTSPENPSQSTSCASDLMSPNVDFPLKPTEKLPTTEEKRTDAGEAQSGPAKSDTAPVQESTEHPASQITHVEELTPSQKEESVVSSTCQTRRGQKVKPKPNLPQTSRTVRPKPQTTKDPVTHMQLVEQPSSPTLKPESTDNTAEGEAHPTCITSSEKPSQSTGPASGLVPSFDVDSTLKPTEELTATEVKNTDVGEVGHEESGAPTSDEGASGNQNLSEVQFEPIREQATGDTRPPSSSVPESGPGSNIDSAPVQESSDHTTPHIAHIEVSQKEGSVVASTCQIRRGQKVKPKPKLPQSPRTMRSKSETAKDPVIQVVEKPCSSTSKPESTDNAGAGLEAQPTCSTSSVSVPSWELCSTPQSTEELSSAEGQKTDVENAPESSLEGSEKNAPQRRRFSKVKPHLGSSTRTTQTKHLSKDTSKAAESHHMDTSSTVTSEQQTVDNNDAQIHLQLAEKDGKELTSTHCSLPTEIVGLPKVVPEGSEKDTTSGGAIKATSSFADSQSVLSDSVVENESSEKPTGEKVEAGLASQRDCKQDVSVRALETHTHATNPEDGSTDSKIISADTQSTLDPRQSTPQPCSENDAQCQDVTQQSSETSAQRKASESTDSSMSSRKAPQTRRGRLIKPKPSLGRRSQSQQIQKTKEAEADSGAYSEDASLSHEPVCEIQPSIQEPMEGAIEQRKNQASPSSDAGSSLGCMTQVTEQPNERDPLQNVAGSSLAFLTQVPDNSAQDGTTSSTEGTQSHPNVTIFTDMLPEQMPSDPDEPFFILSLTEIPVCSLGEVVSREPELVPYPPVTDASAQQQSSAPGGLAAAEEDGPLSNVAAPAFTEVSGETGVTNVKDTGLDPAGSIMENPVDPHESTTLKPSILSETEKNNETECPPTKRRIRDTEAAAKLQVKSKTKKDTRKTLTAKAAESVPIRDSELPGPSVQPEASVEVITEPRKGSGDYVDVEKETVTGGAQATQTRRDSTRNRKPKTEVAPSSKSPPGKAASKGSKVKTQSVARKQLTPAPVASTSYAVTPTLTPTWPLEETHPTPFTLPTQAEVDIDQTSEHSRLLPDPTPSTSPCTAEHIECVESSTIEEEPTNVSQYFLSDIFTEVEEEQG